MTDYVDNSSESELDEDSGYLVSVSDLMSGLIDRILRDKSLFQIEKWLHL